jgi:hypothetical protein
MKVTWVVTLLIEGLLWLPAQCTAMQRHTASASVLTGWWQSLLTGCLSFERLGKGEIASWFDKKTRTRA